MTATESTPLRSRIRDMRKVAVRDLVVFAGGNPKTHTDRDAELLDASLDEHGYTLPIATYEPEPGKLELIDGHHRVDRIMQRWPDAEVPVLVLDVASVAEGRRVLLSLKHSADWDFTKLESFVADTIRDGATVDDVMRLSGLTAADLDVLSGAPGDFLDRIADAGLPPGPDAAERKQLGQDDVPEPPKVPITKPGDVWSLGDHRLYCADCTTIDPSTITAGMFRADAGKQPEVIGFGFTSPPYNLGAGMLGRGTGPAGKNKGKRYADHDDQMDDDAYAELLTASLNLMLSCCRNAVVNLQSLAANKRVIARWVGRFADHLADRAVWVKGHGAPVIRPDVLSAGFEDMYIFAAKKHPNRGIATADFGGKSISNVHQGPPVRANENADTNAATMPVHVAEWAIGAMGARAAFVVDPFGGTGTTLVVSHQLGKRCATVESDPALCDVVIDRWEKMSGGKAKRSTGKRR